MKDWPYPRILAHRGGGNLAPENTLAAIRLGQSLGFRAHEFDVKLSRDGVAFLLHDDTLERTTTGKGRAGDFTWDELHRLDAGSWHSEAFRGERLASFDDVAALLRSQGTLANVEIKPSPGFERVTGERVAIEAQTLWKGAAVAPLLSSFSLEAIMAAKEAAPLLPRAWLVHEFSEGDRETLAMLEAVSLHADHRGFPLDDIARLHDTGYRVVLYTVNEIARAEQLLTAGVDTIATDNLREFARHFPDFR